MIMDNCLSVGASGRLYIGGVDTAAIAAEYGTPAYVMDEKTIRARMRLYVGAMKEYFPAGSSAYYASKAFSCKEIYRIAASEGMGTDVVSSGELETAAAAGFDMSRVCFHGNNKTEADLELALRLGVGLIAVDNRDELQALSSAAVSAGVRQAILIRVAPGIDPHTHKKISTGSIDSKFGAAIATGQAAELIGDALRAPGIHPVGVHCHIGSQIFENKPFDDAAAIMLHFIAELKRDLGFEVSVLSLGGGYGVRYVDDHPQIDYYARLRALGEEIFRICSELELVPPSVILEPGRSIVADAGITLYTVGSVKTITGLKTYVSVDGGMPDNPRYALYQSQYDAVIANRAAEKPVLHCSIAGRCCESGDLIAENILLQPCRRGDLLAVKVTGAYNYSMASNYNRIPRPPVIMVRDGETRVVIRRESTADLYSLDV